MGKPLFSPGRRSMVFEVRTRRFAASALWLNRSGRRGFDKALAIVPPDPRGYPSRPSDGLDAYTAHRPGMWPAHHNDGEGLRADPLGGSTVGGSPGSSLNRMYPGCQTGRIAGGDASIVRRRRSLAGHPGRIRLTGSAVNGPDLSRSG